MFFFQVYVHEGDLHTVAMIKFLQDADEELLTISHGQLVSCKPQQSTYTVVDVKKIKSVVAAIPHKVRRDNTAGGALVRYGDELPSNIYVDERFVVVEKPGLEMASFSGMAEDLDE